VSSLLAVLQWDQLRIVSHAYASMQGDPLQGHCSSPSATNYMYIYKNCIKCNNVKTAKKVKIHVFITVACQGCPCIS